MPNIGNKRPPTAVSTKGKHTPEAQRRRRETDDDAPIRASDMGRQQQQRPPKPTVPKADPFSDGIVSIRLKDATVVPRVGGDEVTLLREFLQYYTEENVHVTNIMTRNSFMKKAGGRLL